MMKSVIRTIIYSMSNCNCVEESPHNSRVVWITVITALHCKVRLFIDYSPHRSLELDDKEVSWCYLGDHGHTRVNTSPIFFSRVRSLANITLSGSSLRRRVFCVTFSLVI